MKNSFSVGLDPIVPPQPPIIASTNGHIEKIVIDDDEQLTLPTQSQQQMRPATQQQPDIDTTPVPMELEPELSGSAVTNAAVNSIPSISTTPVDLENELREFLESNDDDDVGSLERMLQ